MTAPSTRGRRVHVCEGCGYQRTYKAATATEAAFWFARHSCEKQRRAQERAAAAAERDSAIDRTPRSCLHKQAAHEHGTNAAYILDRCRCHPCARAHAAQEQWRGRQKAYGRYDRYVPAYPVRDHVRELMDAGIGLKRIVALSGTSQGALWKLMYGKRRPDGTQVPSSRVLRTTAEKLQAVTLAQVATHLADGALLDADASARASRRLQSLVAIGWSMTEIGRRLGITHPSNVTPVINGTRRLTAATARRAEALFDELCMTLPAEDTHRQKISASRARRHAALAGWVPPLALDDLDSDTTTEEPEAFDDAAVERALAGERPGRLTHADRVEIVHRALNRGWSLARVERDAGIGRPDRYITREAS